MGSSLSEGPPLFWEGVPMKGSLRDCIRVSIRVLSG